LRDWRVRRSMRGVDADELRRLWQEGIASGPGRLRSIEKIKQEGRRRMVKLARANS
jgi:antitoxin ParD1/3/4